MNTPLLKAMVRCTQEQDGYDTYFILDPKLLKMIIWMLHFAVVCIYSSMTWSMFHFHRSHLLLVFWHSFWTPHCIERTTQREEIGACIGGIDFDHIRQTQEVRNSIPCLSTSTSFSLRCDFHTRVKCSSSFTLFALVLLTHGKSQSYCQLIKPFCWVLSLNYTIAWY